MANPEKLHQPLQDNVRQHRLEVLGSLSPLVAELSKKQLLSPDKAWQPSRYLPEITDPGEPNEQLKILRDEAKNITPAAALVVVSSLITEEGLPMFTGKLGKTAPQTHSEAEERVSPWDVWNRGWAAEESRHGRLLRGWVEMSGVFNREQIERDLHRYMSGGFYPKVEGDPYYGVFFVDGQELNTQLAHLGTGREAKRLGISHLFRMAGALSGDEGRHHGFYHPVGIEIVKRDPVGATNSLHRLVMEGLDMPGKGMPGFDLAVAASSITGMFGIEGYAYVISKMVKDYGMETLPLTGDADQKRHDIIRMSKVLSRRAERFQAQDRTEQIRNVNELARRSDWLKPR